MPRVHLTAIYRQAARSLIIQSARRINAGEPPFLSLEEARTALGPDAELDEDFFFIARHGPESVRDAVLEVVCERIPSRFGLDPRSEVMTLVPMRRGPAGLNALNEELERRLNPGERPVVLARAGLRVGSRIVQTKNDYTADREVMNGEVAFVLDWNDEEQEALLSLDDGEREIVVPAAALETYELAWALTVHRAQGSQFPAVVAPWSTGVLGDALPRAPLHRGHESTAAVRARGGAAGGRDRARAERAAAAALGIGGADRGGGGRVSGGTAFSSSGLDGVPGMIHRVRTPPLARVGRGGGCRRLGGTPAPLPGTRGVTTTPPKQGAVRAIRRSGGSSVSASRVGTTPGTWTSPRRLFAR